MSVRVTTRQQEQEPKIRRSCGETRCRPSGAHARARGRVIEWEMKGRLRRGRAKMEKENGGEEKSREEYR
eukprot:764904-Hanusia_phi.AAC.2